MYAIKRIFVGLFIFFFFSACSMLDDYLLGKDNTVSPKALPRLKQTVSIDSQWSTSLAKSSEGYFKLSPAIDERSMYVARPSGQVYAVETNTGKIDWVVTAPYRLVSGPVLYRDFLALSTNTAKIILMSKEKGQVIREFSVSSDVLGLPLFVDNALVVKTIDGQLYAFDLSSGKKLWRMDHGAPHLILRASSSPVHSGHTIIAGFSDGRVDAIDLDTGSLLWQRSLVYSTGSSDIERLVDIDTDPVIKKDMIYLGSYQGYVAAMLLSDGQLVWSKPVSTYQNIAIDADALYLSDSDDVVWSFDRSGGAVRFKQEKLMARKITAPVRLGPYVLVADQTGFLHVLHASDGRLVARQSLSSGVEIAPVVKDNKVFVLTTSGQLECFIISE